MTSLGEKIRQMRRQRGMTQSELGHGIVSASMMSQIESGRTRPSYTLLTTIANKLDMPVEYFLDDFEDHFATSARLQLAEFWLLIGNYSKVLDVLTSMNVPTGPGADYFQYQFILTRVYRAQGKYQSAVKNLEELREHALKTLDRRLLFLIMKETGYIERALGNPFGAVHEWKRAVELGTSLPSSGHFSQLHFRADIAEICVQLHQLLTETGDEIGADAYLRQATEIVQGQGRFRDIAETLVEEAVQAIGSDSSRAKTLIDTGVNLLQFNSFVEQYALVQPLVEGPHRRERDPWHLSAMATATLHPELFIRSEVDRIRRLLDAGKVQAALNRIKRCFEIIEDYCLETSDFEHRIAFEVIQLKLFQAQALYRTGTVTSAITLVQDLLQQPDLNRYPNEKLKVYGLLLNWMQSHGDTDMVHELQRNIKEQLLQLQVQPLTEA